MRGLGAFGADCVSTRASTETQFAAGKDVDGRNKSGHDNERDFLKSDGNINSESDSEICGKETWADICQNYLAILGKGAILVGLGFGLAQIAKGSSALAAMTVIVSGLVTFAVAGVGEAYFRLRVTRHREVEIPRLERLAAEMSAS